MNAWQDGINIAGVMYRARTFASRIAETAAALTPVAGKHILAGPAVDSGALN